MTDPQEKNKVNASSFIFGEELGEGAYSRVIYAKKKDSGNCFAIKIMNKGFISKERKTQSVMAERKALLEFSHPLINRLYYSFQDIDNLYFVIQYCQGGDLSSVLSLFKKQNKHCPLEIVRFYVAELLLTLDYIHHIHHAVHRDIKPENILLQSSGHISLSDFGTILFLDELESSKEQKNEGNDEKRGRGYTFCGSSCYLSPEVLDGNMACPASDLWAVGCILYQLVTNIVLFHEDNDYLIFEKISSFRTASLTFPPQVTNNTKDLITRLLAINPTDRIGARSYRELYTHPFFHGVEFDQIMSTKSPFIPPLSPLPSVDMDEPSFEEAFAEDQILDKGELPTGMVETVTDFGSIFPSDHTHKKDKKNSESKTHHQSIKTDSLTTSNNPSVFLQSQVPLDQLLPLQHVDWNTINKSCNHEQRQQAFTTAHGFRTEDSKELKPKDTNRCYSHLLDSSEEVLYSSIVLRGRCFSIHRYHLVLTTRPRIFCLKVHNGKLELNMAIRQLNNVQLHTDQCFSFEDVVTQKKYIYRSIQGDVKMWVETINSMCSFVNGDYLCVC